MRAAGGIVGSALVDARGLVESAFLDTMRSQCPGLTLLLGQEGAIGQAVFHACMVLPDTLEGCLSTFAVFVSEYPATQCVCKLGQGEFVVLSREASSLGRHCLGRENAGAQHAWMLELEFRTEAAGRNAACFAAMDGANARLRSLFDNMFRRLYMLGQHAGSSADCVLSSVTGETEACDTFDVSPYVLSIIPEPIDYFMHFSDTADCRTRCYYDFSTSRQRTARSRCARALARGWPRRSCCLWRACCLGSMTWPRGARLRRSRCRTRRSCRRRPPVVCGEGSGPSGAPGEEAEFPNSCLTLAGMGRDSCGLTLSATAYYCLPIDMVQRVREWGAQPPRQQGYQLSSAAGAAPEQLPADELSDAEPASFAEGWLSSIARVQVLPSGVSTEAAIISVFGHRAKPLCGRGVCVAGGGGRAFYYTYIYNGKR